jgi:glycosyltransferase involved in cell wall biosynthesis
MRILNLYSDWKWTGPIEPVLNLMKVLAARGHEITFAYGHPPYETDRCIHAYIDRYDLNPTTQFLLNHVLKWNNWSSVPGTIHDLRHLPAFIEREGFDLIQVHRSHDHFVGGIAARISKNHPPIIRMDHKRNSISSSFSNKFLLSRFTDGLITFSRRSMNLLQERFGFPLKRMVIVNPALDLNRPDFHRDYKDMRPIFKFPESAFVIGNVARFQKYRGTDRLIEAIHLLRDRLPNLRLLLVGRSGEIKESVEAPIRKFHLEDRVVLAGYRMDDYFDTLATMDCFVFLTPGSDGTARALREAMVLGLPVIVAKRGMLPELVDEGNAGLIVKDTPENLAQAIFEMATNKERRDALGKAARDYATAEFRLDRLARTVESFYQKILTLHKEEPPHES